MTRLSSKRALKNAPCAATVHSKDTCRRGHEVLGESVLVTETKRGPIWDAQISSTNSHRATLAESLVVSVVTSGLPFASFQHATDNHCESHMWTAHWHQHHPHSFPKKKEKSPSVVEINNIREHRSVAKVWFSEHLNKKKNKKDPKLLLKIESNVYFLSLWMCAVDLFFFPWPVRSVHPYIYRVTFTRTSDFILGRRSK